MPPEDYWHGGPELTWAYREAYKTQKIERNYELWLQGYYFFEALNSAIARKPYLEKPIEIFQKEETEEEMDERLDKEAIALERRLNALAKQFNGSNSK